MSEQIAAIKRDRDAFGHMLYQHLDTGKSVEVTERDDGFIGVGPGGSVYFAPFEEWPAHLRQAMDCLRPGRVLDLGCGAGRVELYLQERGVEVVGIDVSPLALEVCRRRGVRDARLLSVTQVSRALGQFDNILMAGNNFGLMGSPERARWLLRRFHAVTTPGARILAESNDVYQTDSPVHLAYQAWNRERGRLSGQLRLRVRWGLLASEWFDYLMVSKTEMEAILAGTGWGVSKFIDSDRSQYVAVIEKL